MIHVFTQTRVSEGDVVVTRSERVAIFIRGRIEAALCLWARIVDARALFLAT